MKTVSSKGISQPKSLVVEDYESEHVRQLKFHIATKDVFDAVMSEIGNFTVNEVTVHGGDSLPKIIFADIALNFNLREVKEYFESFSLPEAKPKNG